MKINSSLLVLLAVGAVSGAAQADVSVLKTDSSNINIYGIADAAYGSVQNSFAVNPTFPASVNPVTAISSSAAGVGTVIGAFNGGISGSRLGVKGDTDLGSGYKGFFVVEAGINVTTMRMSNAAVALASNSPTQTTAAANSSIDGQFDSRQGFVGVSSSNLGSLALGRTYAPIYDVVVAYDPVQAAQLFSPLGFSGTYGGGGGVSEDTRVDGSLKYWNKTGNINYGALVKFAGADASEPGSAYAANIGYDNGTYGVQFAYQAFQDGVSAGVSSVSNQVKLTVYDTSAFMLAAKYKLTADATLKAGYESYTLSAPASPLTGAMSYYGQSVAANSNLNYGTTGDGAAKATNIYFIGGDYNVTPKLNVAVGYYDVSLQQSADAGASQKSGDLAFTSLLLDYRFSPALDTYFGVMAEQLSGNYYATGYLTSNQIAAIGARYKF